MVTPIRNVLGATLLLGLAACAAAPVQRAPIPLRVSEADGVCRVQVQGRNFEVTSERDALVSVFRKLAVQGHVVDFTPLDVTTPYGCLATAMFLVQRAGLRFVPIGFVSEPKAN